MRVVMLTLLLAGASMGQRGGLMNKFGGRQGRLLACVDEAKELCSLDLAAELEEGALEKSVVKEAFKECFDTLNQHLTEGTGDLSVECQERLVEMAAKKEEKQAKMAMLLASASVVEQCGEDFCPDLDYKTCIQSAEDACKEAIVAAKKAAMEAEKEARISELLESEAIVTACGEDFCPDLDLRTCLTSSEVEVECREAFRSSAKDVVGGRRRRFGSSKFGRQGRAAQGKVRGRFGRRGF